MNMEKSAEEEFEFNFWKSPSSGVFPVYPFCMEKMIGVRHHSFAHNGHDFLMFIAVADGELIYEIDNRIYPVVPGKILVIPAFTAYRFSNARQSSRLYRKIVAEISGPALDFMTRSFGLEKPLLFEDSDGAVRNVLERLMALSRSYGDETFPEVSGGLYTLFTMASRSCRESDRVEQLVEHAKALLEKDFQNPYSIPEVAQKLGISRAKLNRLFREHTMLSPIEYRIQKKMEQARYLFDTPMSIKEIADMLGYSSQFHFTNEFRRLNACSPREFRRNLQTKNVHI